MKTLLTLTLLSTAAFAQQERKYDYTILTPAQTEELRTAAAAVQAAQENYNAVAERIKDAVGAVSQSEAILAKKCEWVYVSLWQNMLALRETYTLTVGNCATKKP